MENTLDSLTVKEVAGILRCSKTHALNVIEGRVHAHMTLADDEKAFGGHIEPGNPVFTFAIVTLGILEDNVTLDKVDDKTYR